MDSFQSVLGDAAGGALCNVLSAYGSSAPLLTAISLVEPTPFGEAVAVSAGLAGLAATVGCQWDPNGQGPPDVSDYKGCRKVTGGYLTGRIGGGSPDNPIPTDIIAFAGAIEIYSFGYAGMGFGKHKYEWDVLRESPPGSTPKRDSGVLYLSNKQPSVYTEITGGGTCLEPAPAHPPQPPTYTYQDPDSGCELNVDFKGWGVDNVGNVNGIWQIAPASTTLTSGGVIGGCNFAPTIYIDGGSGGGSGGGGGGTTVPVPDPVPPDGDEPWWAPLARGAAAGLAASATEAVLEKLFATNYEGGSYELKGVCERDKNGQPMDVTKSTNFPPAPGIDAVLYRLDAIAEMFQFDKELRQPTCRIKPTLTGEWVTVNFISDKASSGGERPLRKVFRYRDQTASPLKVHLDHWVNFTWQAGPVIVISKNLSWGTPQVWAASIEEGKRVISHAAQVAGVDLTDPNHEWVISGTDDPRYGRTGTMRLDTRGGLFDRVTKRPGPSGLPYGYSPAP